MKRAALFLLTTLILLYAIRALEYAGLRRNAKGEYAKLRQAFLESHPCDLLILGSSRAECQFYPPVIDSATGLHSFNIGMIGATLPFVRTALESYLENSPAPRFAILNLDIHSLTDNPDTVHNFPRYFAFLSNEKLYSGLHERDHRFTAFRYFAPYSMAYFNDHYLNASLRGWMNKPGKYDATYIQGYTPCEINPRLGNYDTVSLPQLSTGFPDYYWKELDAIRKICAEKKIRLILVLSPVHDRQRAAVRNYTELESALGSYASRQSLPLINLGNSPLSSGQQYYADPAHFNEKGAILFSRTFSDSLTQYIRP